MSDRRCTAHTSAGRRAAQLDAHQAAEWMLAEAGVDADPIEHLVDSLRLTGQAIG